MGCILEASIKRRCCHNTGPRAHPVHGQNDMYLIEFGSWYPLPLYLKSLKKKHAGAPGAWFLKHQQYVCKESFSGEKHNFQEVDHSISLQRSSAWPWRNSCLFCKESVLKGTTTGRKPNKRKTNVVLNITYPKNMMTIWLQPHNEMLKHIEHEHSIWCPSYDSNLISVTGPFPPCSCGPDHAIRSESQKKNIGKHQGVLFVTGYFKTIFTHSALKTVRKEKHMGEDIHKSQSEAVDFSIQLKYWRRNSFRHSWKHTSPEFWDADFNTTQKVQRLNFAH